MRLPSPVDIWQPWVSITVIFKTQSTTVNLKHKDTLSLLKEMLSSSPIFAHMLSMFWLILARLQIYKTLSSVDSRYKIIVILGHNLNIELHPQQSPDFNRGFQRAFRTSSLNANVRNKCKFSLKINENRKYFSSKNSQYQ